MITTGGAHSSTTYTYTLQEQEACLKLEAQTLRDVVRERDACHSTETESLKAVVKAMHDEMKRICDENDRLKLQISEMRKGEDAEEQEDD